MKFQIQPQVFEQFPDFCVAVVAVDGLQNKTVHKGIVEKMKSTIANTHEYLKDKDIREMENIKVWREAFESLGINPNRFPSSIEALAKRVSKKPTLPVINNVVNLVNTVAVECLVPMGAHDIDKIQGDLEIRFSNKGERFTPFGSSEEEKVEEKELVYGDEEEVRTRKWVWRQGEKGKVDDCTERVFFPIDGFYGKTDEDVSKAQSLLETEIKKAFPSVSIQKEWVDKDFFEVMLLE